MQKTKKTARLNEAIETMQQAQHVNQFIQGVCARISAQELNEGEAMGLWAVLEWQNEKLRGAELVIGNVLVGDGASVQAA